MKNDRPPIHAPISRPRYPSLSDRFGRETPPPPRTSPSAALSSDRRFRLTYLRLLGFFVTLLLVAALASRS